MGGKIKYLMFALLFFLLIANVSALEVLKPAKLNQTYTIVQTCSSCTHINITISNINGIVAANKAMINNGSGVWTYNITPSIVSRHDITGQGDLNGVETSFATYFEVTPSGKQASTGDSIIYAIFCFILFFIILAMFFFIFTMPSKNEKDEKGSEIKILKLKYVRVFFIALTYPLIILLLNFLTGLAVNFSALSLFEGTLGFLFEMMLRATWGFIMIIILWIGYMLIHDSNVKKHLNKIGSFKI